jgi:regulatory protein YycI of two-component signal transduction system YycFG
MTSKEKEQFLLIQLILMFQTAALQQMGKLKNPVSDKIEQDLNQAQISIDMLEMLHTKMKGNLSDEEERTFTGVLQELRLNYVDEVAKAQSSSNAPESKPPVNGPDTPPNNP